MGVMKLLALAQQNGIVSRAVALGIHEESHALFTFLEVKLTLNLHVRCLLMTPLVSHNNRLAGLVFHVMWRPCLECESIAHSQPHVHGIAHVHVFVCVDSFT